MCRRRVCVVYPGFFVSVFFSFLYFTCEPNVHATTSVVQLLASWHYCGAEFTILSPPISVSDSFISFDSSSRQSIYNLLCIGADCHSIEICLSINCIGGNCQTSPFASPSNHMDYAMLRRLCVKSCQKRLAFRSAHKS